MTPVPTYDPAETCDRCTNAPSYAVRWREGDAVVLLLCLAHYNPIAATLITGAHRVWPITSLPVERRP